MRFSTSLLVWKKSFFFIPIFYSALFGNKMVELCTNLSLSVFPYFPYDWAKSRLNVKWRIAKIFSYNYPGFIFSLPRHTTSPESFNIPSGFPWGEHHFSVYLQKVQRESGSYNSDSVKGSRKASHWEIFGNLMNIIQHRNFVGTLRRYSICCYEISRFTISK